MRARTPLLLLCLNAVPALCVGQHTHQFEIAAFGSYTRYDRAFMLDKQIGGGGRLGYFFSPVVGIEVDAGYQQPTPAAGGANASLQMGSASLVLNMGNQHNLFYILGGYSRLAFGDRSGCRSSPVRAHSVTPIWTASLMAKMHVPERPWAPSSTRVAARAIPTATRSITASTPVPTRSKVRKSTPAAARRT